MSIADDGPIRGRIEFADPNFLPERTKAGDAPRSLVRPSLIPSVRAALETLLSKESDLRQRGEFRRANALTVARVALMRAITGDSP